MQNAQLAPPVMTVTESTSSILQRFREHTQDRIFAIIIIVDREQRELGGLFWRSFPKNT